MKAVLFLMLFITPFCLLLGVPLRNVETYLEQPDGSKYACFMSGDEYYHRAHDADGYTIIKDTATGWNVYAQKAGPDLVPSSWVPGTDDPAARGLSPNLLPDPSVLRSRFQTWRGASGREYGRAPSIGTVNNLCIFIRFAGETEFGQNLQIYDDMHNSSGQASMKGYFYEESGGQLSVDSSFYPIQPGGMLISWIDAYPRNYYYPMSAGNPIGYPPGPPGDPDQIGFIRLHTMLINAVNTIAPMIPPTLNIDADNDLKVDNLSFICRGNADATSYLFWPHFWQLNAYPATPTASINYMGQPRLAEDYNFSLQFPDPLYTGYGGGIDVAEVCHEFSHTLGFPDLYHYTWDGVNPCGYWDLMDSCYQVPQHHLVYMKWRYGGWCAPPPMLPPFGPLSLNSVATNPFSAYMYQMPTGEQIWIEYRQQAGLYETRVPGTGLLVYRVNQSLYPWGNAGGPPDEVYVYRPGVGASPPDGNINAAHFAWDVGRTAMNQYTDPGPFSQSNPGYTDAAFNLHSVGSGFMSGPQISFDTGTQIPVLWTGSSDNNWFNAANWSTGAVPTASDMVIVSQGLNFCTVPLQIMPPGFVVPAVCQQLRVENQLSVLPNAHIQVNGPLHSIGRIFMDGNQMQVMGPLVVADWYAGSWFQCTLNPAAQIIVGGDCRFESSTNIQLTAGQLIFANLAATPPTNTFTCDALTAMLNDLTVNKPNCSLIMDSILPFPPLFIQGNLSVNTATIAGSSLIVNSPRPIFVNGNISIAANCLLQVPDTNNMISMVGNPGPQTVLTPNPANYFHHLDINNGASPMLGSNITVKGDLSINSGSLVPGVNTIYLHGNWIDNVGAGAFQKGGSRVCFCGSPADQSILMNSPSGANLADFHILELNKSAGALAINAPGLQVNCDSYDWTAGMLKVTDGQFTAQDLADGYVAGSFTCNAPGMIDLTDQSGMGDLNASLMIQGGTFNVHTPSGGPGLASLWGAQPTSIVMNSGQITYHDVGIHIIPAAPFSTNISGGVIQSTGDFLIMNSGFTPTGGTVTVSCPTPGVVSQVGTTPGSWFHDLHLQTQTDAANATQINGTLMVDPPVSMLVHDCITVNGSLQLAGAVSFLGTSVSNIASPNLMSGSSFDVADASVAFTGTNSVQLDGNINVNDGWLNATDCAITVAPAGSITFGIPGPGYNGKLSCANLTANTPGTFVPSVGTLEFANTSASTVYAFGLPSGNWVHDLDVNLQSSVQLMTDLAINGNLHIASGQLVMDNSGRTLSLMGNWSNDIPGSGFARGNGIVDFQGTVTMTISANGGSEDFHKLQCHSGTLVLADDVNVHDDLDLTGGTLQLNSQVLSVSGNTNLVSGGVLVLNPGAVLESGNGKQVRVQSGASLQSLGNSGNPAILRGQSGAFWQLDAQSGSNLAASYTAFEDLSSSGVNVQSGVTVDLTYDFDDCVFQDGAAGTTYLSIANSQDLSISGISFPSPSTGGFNIAKSNAAGSISVTSSSGSFAGPLYENDPNALIAWTGYDPNLIVEAFNVSDNSPYVADQVSYNVTIKNDSANPVQSSFKIHLFKNRGSAPGWSETGDMELTCPTLNPGQTYSTSFSGVYSMSPASWTSWLLIDPEAAVAESDETDNRDSDTLAWNALPVASSIAVTQTGSSTAQITWSYPIWVSRFKLYWASDPYGSYSYLGSTSNNYYDIPLDQSGRFFSVSAERDAPAK